MKWVRCILDVSRPKFSSPTRMILSGRPLTRERQCGSSNLYSKVPAAGFEPAHFGLKELARLSVWQELGYPARFEQKLISS